jgi:hydroxyethylthiazole kinase-like uncharacterized protein yjeF
VTENIMTQDQQPCPEYRITADQLKLLGKSGDRHKYAYGHAIVVSGPAGQGGAARLAARGALRIGAGLVSVFSAQDAKAEHAARLDAIMLKTYSDDRGFADQLSALKPSAVCIGPNFGLSRDHRNKLSETLSLRFPLCLDADAITLIAQEPDLIKAVSHAQVIMTPHEGELRRLIPNAFDKTSCRVSLAKIAAREMGCNVLFKGADTIVARPSGDCIILKSKAFAHAAWLATAGSGDVLSGFITGLMVRGFASFDAAALGASLHLQCAEVIGPGLIAEDIPDALPSVLARYLAVQTAQ